MVKTKEEIVSNPAPISKLDGLKKGVKKVVYVAIAGGAVYGLWQNPEIIGKARELMSVASSEVQSPAESALVVNDSAYLLEEVKQLRSEISQLRQQQLSSVDTTALEEKVSSLEKNNNNIIDSKADVATVLGLITRLDKAEEKLDTLAKVSDEGALVLTATMLVKDSADRGGNFEYEAEVLQQIAGHNVEVKSQIAIIAKYAKSGIETNKYLMDNFETVYNNLMKLQREEFEKTWKDRINNKLSEYIKVKRVHENTPQFQANQELEVVKSDVENANFARAIAALDKLSNKELLNEPSLQKWLEGAKAKVDFSNAISEISTRYLAIMKVNFLKK